MTSITKAERQLEHLSGYLDRTDLSKRLKGNISLAIRAITELVNLAKYRKRQSETDAEREAVYYWFEDEYNALYDRLVPDIDK